jgi:hypothetical protein
MEIELISERKIKIGEKEYPIRIIELSGGIHIINILEKVYGKELEYLECKREKIRVKIGKRKDKYVPMVELGVDIDEKVYGIVQLIEMS